MEQRVIASSPYVLTIVTENRWTLLSKTKLKQRGALLPTPLLVVATLYNNNHSNHRHIDTPAEQTVSIYTTQLLSNTVLLLLSSFSRGIEPESLHSASVAAVVGHYCTT